MPEARDKAYRISGQLREYDIILPHDHALPRYQNEFKQYDRKIAAVAAVVYRVKGGQCLDIGANVGDTALSIRSSTDMPIICIEGDASYFSYLDRNTQGKDSIRLICCFVGKETRIERANVVKTSGTGKITSKENHSREISLFSLGDILQREGIGAGDITLLKIDTDGYDFDILLGSQELLKQHKPSLFFEYEIQSQDADQKSLEVIKYLWKLGYKFIVYDNYGNFMSLITAEAVDRFSDLNTYIVSCGRYGGGIYYADVFASTDDEVISTVSSMERVSAAGWRST
jgi:FkbM family methyltransferase